MEPLWTDTLTGPIFCFEKTLLRVLCTVIDRGVVCDFAFGPRPPLMTWRTSLPVLALFWGEALPAGLGVRMMIASWPRLALYYIHNETFTSSAAASKWWKVPPWMSFPLISLGCWHLILNMFLLLWPCALRPWDLLHHGTVACQNTLVPLLSSPAFSIALWLVSMNE